MSTPYIFKIGGSLIAPEHVDVAFLKKLHSFLKSHLARKHRFILVCGGGAVARHYITAARKLNIPETETGWVGVAATHLNAHLVQVLLGDVTHVEIVRNQILPADWRSLVLVAGGTKPGQSTDAVAVELAKQAKAATIYKISNIDAVYEADPKKTPDAKPLKTIAWHDYLTIIDTTWQEGMSAPFDPVAARLAQKAKMTAQILTGTDFTNIDACLNGSPFNGTTIS